MGHEPDHPRGPRPPRPPGHLSPEAREHWRRLVPELVRQGIITALSRDLVARYCEVLVMAQRAVRWVDRSESVVEGRRERVVSNPAWRVYRDIVDLQLALARELGLLGPRR